jgi:hypothetical protein
MNTTIRDRILALAPCSPARDWLVALPADADPEQLYLTCSRASWLVWLAVRAGVDYRTWLPALCDCMRRMLPHAQVDVPLRTVEVLERYARGEATIEEVRAASAAANAAALAAAVFDAAAYAAYATAYAADAAYAASRAASRADANAAAADIIRARIPWAMIAEALIKGTA